MVKLIIIEFSSLASKVAVILKILNQKKRPNAKLRAFLKSANKLNYLIRTIFLVISTPEFVAKR